MYRLTRHVVIEGPNGGGKTTLVQVLKTIGLPHLHTGGPKNSAGEILEKMNEVCRTAPSIVERIPAISQVVYDRACEREEHCPPKQVWRMLAWQDLDNVRPTLGNVKPNPLFRPVVIYCRPSHKRLMDASLHNGATHSPGHITEIQTNRMRVIGTYDRLISELSARGYIRPIFYDWEAGTTPQAVVTALLASSDLVKA